MTELRDKQCFITGAANGIGRALAYAAARAGARLVLVDIDGPALDAVAADLRTTGASVLAAEPLDVADTPAVSAFADHVLAVHGSMDVVMNVAGIAIWGEITRCATSAGGASWTSISWGRSMRASPPASDPLTGSVRYPSTPTPTRGPP